MPKFYQFSYEKSAKEIGSKIRDLYTQNTITDYKETFKNFKERYNNVIHQKLIEKYLNNIESLYKYISLKALSSTTLSITSLKVS